MNVDWLVAIVVTGGGILFGAGAWYSDVNNKIEQQEMKRKTEQLRKVVSALSDSLRLFQLPKKVPDKNAKPPNDAK